MKVLITGASSGIGRNMAQYLHDYNYKLFLVSKDKKKLDEVFKNYSNVVTFGFDLTKKDECIKLYNTLKDEKIDILINNAGFGDAGNFIITNLKKELDMINVNIKAYHILMKLFLKDFVKKGYGRILNVASISGFMPGPYMATYYATKAYIVNLSLAVYEELRQINSKVKIAVFCPGPVKTNFSKKAHVHFNIGSITAKEAANIAVEGMFKNKLIIFPVNMKLNYILTKAVLLKLTLMVSSLVQERENK